MHVSHYKRINKQRRNKYIYSPEFKLSPCTYLFFNRIFFSTEHRCFWRGK